MPLFSIIMPAYNAEKYICDAIDSVLSQTLNDFELIICNDSSLDGTQKLIEKYLDKDSRIKLINNKFSKGVAGARNTAISESLGKYICFLDSDDLWRADKLEKQLVAFQNGYDVVCSNYIVFKENGVKYERVSNDKIHYKDLLKSGFIGNLTGSYNASKLGKFYQYPVGHEDYIMWLEILKVAKIAYCIQLPLAFYRVSNSSLSSNKFRNIFWQWNIYRKILKLSLSDSILYLNYYIFYGIKKRICLNSGQLENVP